jgi:hypothetical protein
MPFRHDTDSRTFRTHIVSPARREPSLRARTRWFTQAALGALCVVVVCLSPASGLGQVVGADDRARTHFVAATRAFNEGDYASSVREFSAAYELSGAADLLFNIYSAAERAGLLDEAERALARYLEVSTPGSDRTSLEARLSRLRARIAESRRAEGPAPVVPRIEPDASASSAEASAASESTASPLALEMPSAPTATGLHPATVVTFVSAGALFVSFGIFAGLSETEDQALATHCRRDVGSSCTTADVKNLQTFNTLADVSWIAGAALSVAGFVMVFALPARTENSPSTLSGRVIPWLDASGAGVRVVGQW